MAMDPVLLASLLTIPLYLLLLGIRWSISQKAARIPSPSKLPFIGNLHQLGPIPHLSLNKLSKEHGPLMLLHLGVIPTLVVSSPKVAEEVIRNYDLVFASRPTTKVANALSYNDSNLGFAKYGENWRNVRRAVITNLFSSNRFKSFTTDRAQEVSMMIEKVTDAASKGNGVVCVTDILNSYSINIITRVLFGSGLSEDKKKLMSKLAHNTASLLSQINMEDFFPYLKWLDVPLGFDGIVKNHKKTWDVLMEEVIKDHYNNLKEANATKSTYFIDSLIELQSGKGFVPTMNHFKAILMDLITAGADTTFVTLDWCMTELIRNPRVMMKVKEEIKEIASGEYMVTEEHLGKMKYLKAFIKEICRLHPPSPLLVPRESLQECQILGYNIPKKTRLIFNAWALGRDASNWAEPELLKPERFLDDTSNNKDNGFNLMTFGSGCRICPGMNLAKVIIELGVANLLHRFDWSLPSGITVEDIDMAESGEIVSERIQKLELVPMARKVY